MNNVPNFLSKTKLMRGYRCLKNIYLTIHHPELETPIDTATQALFDQGTQIGTLARDYYPGGQLIENKPWDFIGALNKTKEFLANPTHILYEAAFEYMGCYARIDIMQYSTTTKRWRLFEVKSSTKLKPEHIDDVGLQAWIIAKSGLPIEQINIVHLNPSCLYPNLNQLFIEVDVTQQIRETYLSIQPKIYNIMSAIKNSKEPAQEIGPHCLAPTPCSFMQYCWMQKNIPKVSVFNLVNIKNRKWELYQQGIIRLEDDRLDQLDSLQSRMVECSKTKTRFIDIKAIQEILELWPDPLVFLDFETINPAVPRYPNSAPYHHVPFQFSVHICSSNEELIHHHFLYESEDDPRPSLIEALLKACGTDGPIITYYSKFEMDRIQALADFSPVHHDALLKLNTRIVDLLPVIRNHIYDPAFCGSFSLKNVAPALLGEQYSYVNMIVAKGDEAQRAFEELISPKTPSSRKIEVKHALLEYCKKDTLVMVDLVKWLKQQITIK